MSLFATDTVEVVGSNPIVPTTENQGVTVHAVAPCFVFGLRAIQAATWKNLLGAWLVFYMRWAHVSKLRWDGRFLIALGCILSDLQNAAQD